MTENIEDLTRVRHMCREGEARRIRLRAHASGGEVADVVGVTPSTISRWERGLLTPRGQAALRYLEALNTLADAA